MPKLRKFTLETPSARLRLPVRKLPYRHRIGPGRSLGYRRNQNEGAWVAVLGKGDGSGDEITFTFGAADDREPADGKRILSFAQALETARKLTPEGDVENIARPVTLKSALAVYAADLKGRNAGGYNARWALVHAPASLLNKPIELIDVAEWRRWRDSLSATLAPASVNRLCRTVVAALNLAVEHNAHITSRTWRVGLKALADATQSRNEILSDDEVRAFRVEAYAIDSALGLFVEVADTTGARSSQICRLEVGDLRNSPEPTLLMPRSGKGGGRMRARKKIGRIPVPITVALAQRLAAAAKGRPSDAPLLVRSDGKGWGPVPHAHYRKAIPAIVTAIGLDPKEVTFYALRHSSIVRQLIANVPIRIVASAHDTSVQMIEATYSRHIVEHSDQVLRKALLRDTTVADNVVAMR